MCRLLPKTSVVFLTAVPHVRLEKEWKCSMELNFPNGSGSLIAFNFGPGGFAMRSWPLFALFSLSFFLRLLTHFGESPVCEKKYFLGNFYFFTKKKQIFEHFFYFLWPAFDHEHLGHPQSLEF